VIEINETAVLLTILGLLMIVSVLSSRGFERLGVPVVLLFLMVGMLAGSEGIGGLAFNDYRLAFRIGTGALILILLDGGLNTPMAAVKESIKPAGILATVGVALTAGLLAVCSHLLGLSWEESLLLGAVVS
jgi:cell volume regulation protein A